MRVRIYRPSKSAAQSGQARTYQWIVEPETASPRLPEPIMGWSQAGDTMTELRGRLKFDSLDDALLFVKGRGWEALVEQPAERKIRPRNYLDNFRIVRPMDEERAAQ